MVVDGGVAHAATTVEYRLPSEEVEAILYHSDNSEDEDE
jgi:hypothetical protein